MFITAQKMLKKFINLPILGVVPFFNFETKDILELDNKEEEKSTNNIFTRSKLFYFSRNFSEIFIHQSSFPI